jgi:hypothetical protein
LLKQTRDVLQTIQECEIAERAFDDLQLLIQAERLSALTTMKIIDQLISESNQLLDAGKYRQARFIAGMCLRDIKALQRQNRTDDRKAQTLSVKIGQLQGLCAQARWWETGTAFSLPSDRAFRALNSLLEEARLTLVEGLLNDLELELAPTKAFLTEYARYRSGFERPLESTSVSDDALKQLIARESWEAGTEYLLKNELEMLGKRVQSIQPKIRQFVERVASEISVADSEVSTEAQPESSVESQREDE